MTSERKSTAPMPGAFGGLRPVVTTRKHDLGEGGYAILTILEGQGHVTASLATSETFRPVPMYFEGADLVSVVGKVEAAFEEMHPTHASSEACDLHWRRPLPGAEDSSDSSGSVN